MPIPNEYLSCEKLLVAQNRKNKQNNFLIILKDTYTLLKSQLFLCNRCG